LQIVNLVINIILTFKALCCYIFKCIIFCHRYKK